MHQSQGSRIIDMCIIHTCIRVKDRGTLINASYTHVSGSCILLLESPCSFVRWSVTKFQPHHTHMHHSQGSRITDVCIIHKCIMHICIMIKDNRCMHHTCMYQGQGSWINASYICAAWPHASCIMHRASCIIGSWINASCIVHHASLDHG